MSWMNEFGEFVCSVVNFDTEWDGNFQRSKQQIVFSLQDVAVLDSFAIEREPEIEIIWIGDFIASSPIRPKWGMRVSRFSFHPLPSFIQLPFAFAVIVMYRIAGDELVSLIHTGEVSDEDFKLHSISER